MPKVVVVDEEALEKLEDEGWLLAITLEKRKRAYEHFCSYFKEETGVEVEECLQSEGGTGKFAMAFGRYDQECIGVWND